MSNYHKCVLMSNLARDVVLAQVKNNGRKKLWRVHYDGRVIGFIETGNSYRNDYKYLASTVFGHELDRCSNFMQALAQFIDYIDECKARWELEKSPT